MRYHGEEALGLIETTGMVPAILGADSMLKAADVELIAYENVGSTLVTIFVKGDVGAVKASVDAGAAAAGETGHLTASNVMPRPIRAVGDIVSVHDVDAQVDPEEKPIPFEALGMVETFGIVYVLEAADAMVKASGVQLLGYENTASGYISVLVTGDVGACQAAVEAGVAAVQQMGKEPHSSCLIPRPHRDLSKIIGQYALDKLLPAPVTAEKE